ncbi:hypothetical protein [Ammoniphilus sp. CFH 90114]|uniref:hypothetical protein n=1 Tax=Ammoniphilus sp. CFH 90114 TaxID=2493665 RepID=UPI00100F4347|nr:hypothetical protein [Ammoniphilus sp. CFH 90114]RXT02843.1 hypothetical protein EIZ39_24205 [Ammoniphilus sp. CFH 90114]
MHETCKRVGFIWMVVMLFSLTVSMSALAVSEKRVEGSIEETKGMYVTISNVIKMKEASETGYPYDLYIANAPVTVTFGGKIVNKSIQFYGNAMDGTINHDVQVKDNSALLKLSGYYEVGFSGDDSVGVGEGFFIQVQGGSTTLPATPTASKVLVNGKEVSFEAYNINGSNYFKLRDIAMAVNETEKNFEVTWDSAENAINLTSNKAYTPDGKELTVSDKPTVKQAKPSGSRVLLDGLDYSFTAYNLDGSNYFKLREIAEVIGFGVTFNVETNTIGIDTKAEYTN